MEEDPWKAQDSSLGASKGSLQWGTNGVQEVETERERSLQVKAVRIIKMNSLSLSIYTYKYVKFFVFMFVFAGVDLRFEEVLVQLLKDLRELNFNRTVASPVG